MSNKQLFEKKAISEENNHQTYSTASTSRLLSSPVDKNTNIDTNSDKLALEDGAPNEPQSRMVSKYFFLLVKYIPVFLKEVFQLFDDTTERSHLVMTLQELVNRENKVRLRDNHVCKNNEPISDENEIKNMEPKSDSHTVYVERKGKFYKMKRSIFRKEQEMNMRQESTGLAGQLALYAKYLPSTYQDVVSAYILQHRYHNVSMIMQGFLSGLTVAEAVFAFNFANEELLLQGYRWMSLPVHVVFTICFTIGCISAYDRTHFYGWNLSSIRKTLSHSGIIGVVLWSMGLVATVVCIRFDESLAPIVEKPLLTEELLLYWRICSAVRAVCASSAWLLLALRPDCVYIVKGNIFKNYNINEYSST
uniref:Uncharacterized protein n=1 Tax=Heterorhabditis bacteriophora TaxID=37862 RepID=A0A1I7X8G5_HETBA